MQKISSIIDSIISTFPEFTFLPGDENRWSPNNKIVHYDPLSDPAYLLHETAHGILGHKSYTLDVELLAIERDAWEYAKESLAGKFGVTIDSSTISDSINTYRDWLHSRSLCPKCESTGLQQASRDYSCLSCGAAWRVNEAKTVGLKRHQVK